MFVVAVGVGDAFDSIKLHGPFDDGETAGEYAERECRGYNWYIVPVHAIEEEGRQMPKVNRFSDLVWKDNRDTLLASLYGGTLHAIHEGNVGTRDTEIIAYARDKETAERIVNALDKEEDS